jgi:hypothetical protein
MSSSQRTRRSIPDSPHNPDLALSEADSHREHAAALEATVFRRPGTEDELVFELDGGHLRLRARIR